MQTWSFVLSIKFSAGRQFCAPKPARTQSPRTLAAIPQSLLCMKIKEIELLNFGSLTTDIEEKVKNNYSPTGYFLYPKNIEFTESLIKEFPPGIYKETDIPEDIKMLTNGRIEIDFRYDGGALNSFMPLLYYGSINKNNNDNAVEETAFHLVVEVGHYTVIPLPVEYLFYTISTFSRVSPLFTSIYEVTSLKNIPEESGKKAFGKILMMFLLSFN